MAIFDDLVARDGGTADGLIASQHPIIRRLGPEAAPPALLAQLQQQSAAGSGLFDDLLQPGPADRAPSQLRDAPGFTVREEAPRPFIPGPGSDLGRAQSAASNFEQGFASMLADVPREIGILQGQLTDADPRETGAFQAGQALDDFVRSKVPVNPNFSHEFSQKLARGFGTAAGFLTGGLIGGASKAARIGIPALLGAASGGVAGFQDAVMTKPDISLDDAFLTSNLAAGLGTTEAFMIARVLGRLDKGSGGSIRRIMRETLLGGTEEAVQEGIQSIGENLIASDIVKFDPERGTFTGVVENVEIGFTIGGVFSFLATALGGRRGRVGVAAPAGAAAPLATPVADTPTRAAVIADRAKRRAIAEKAVEDAREARDEALSDRGIDPNSAEAQGLLDAFDAARAEQERVKAEITAEVQAEGSDRVPVAPPVEPAPGPGASFSVFTPRGAEVEVQEQIVESDSLIVSHSADGAINPDFPSRLQPRDRTRAASQAQIAEIAGSLRPELLGRSVTTTDGAPIVGEDNVVESGNARVLAIRRALRGDPQKRAEYREFLASQGYDLSGFAEPVLVRRRVTPLDVEGRLAFVRESNERTTLAQSPTETATTDAAALTNDLLSLYQGGAVDQAQNRAFVRRFFDTVVSPAERGGLINATGELSQAGARRVENALFAKAYETPELLAALREDRDTNIRAIGGALIDVAPAFARLRSRIAAGEVRPEVDGTAALVEAVGIVRRARTTGQKVGDIVATIDAFNPISAQATGFLRLLFRDVELRRPAGRSRIVEDLTAFVDQAGRASAAPQLLDLPSVGVTDILDRIAQQREGGLLPTAAFPSSAAGVRGLPDIRAVGPGLFDDLVQARAARGRGGGGQAGENFQGLIETAPTRQPGEIPSEAPIRRADILRPLLRELGATVTVGRMGKRRVLGFFRPRLEEVRIRRNDDIEVTAHELAHLLDDRFPELRRQWKPASRANAIFRDELRGISYDKTKLFEGFAEFVRHWSTQDEIARQAAPNFYNWFEAWVDRSGHGPALRQAKAEMHEWFAQDALNRARSKFGFDRTINDILSTVPGRFREFVVDDLQGLKVAQGELDITGPYETARTARGAGGLVWGAMRFGAPRRMSEARTAFVDLDGNPSTLYETEPGGRVRVIPNPEYRPSGLMQILGPVSDNLEAFGLYAVGRRAALLRSQGRENLFDPAEIQAMQALETEERRAVFERWNKFNSQVLDFAQQSGLIDARSREQWETNVYVPFWRADKSRPSGKRGGIAGRRELIVRLRGGTTNLRDPVQNMFENTRLMVEAAVYNHARKTAVDQIRRAPGGGRFFQLLPLRDERVRVLTSTVKQAIFDQLDLKMLSAIARTQRRGESAEEAAAQADARADIINEAVEETFESLPAFLQVIRTGQPPAGAGNVIAVMRGGRAQYFEVPEPMVFRAMSALPREILFADAPVMKLLRGARRLGQTTITLSLEFLQRNIFRDAIMATALTRFGFVPFVDSARGLKNRATSDPIYQEFLANGGAIAGVVLDSARVNARLAPFYARRGIPFDSVITTTRKFAQAVEQVADAFEIATRLGEFGRGVRGGASPLEAAFASREVSSDFAMRGDSRTLGLLYDSIIFLKAGIVGLDRGYRGLAPKMLGGEGRARAAIVAGTIATLSVALYAINRGNPLFDDLEDWARDTHWHTFVPNQHYYEFIAREGREPRTVEEARDLYVHNWWPKPWELGSIGSIAERSVERIVNDQPEKLAGDMLRIVREMLRYEWRPQIIAPLWDVGQNRLSFLDRPIEPQSVQGLPKWQRATTRTSRSLRAFGENVLRKLPDDAQKISPAQIEALLRGYFNTWAAYGLTLSDQVFFDDAPEIPADRIPGVRAFYRKRSGSRTTTMFYDMLREATEARNALRRAHKAMQPELFDELIVDEDLPGFRPLSGANATLQKFSRVGSQVSNAPDIATLQKIGVALGRTSGSRQAVAQIRRTPRWNDFPALKRDLLNHLSDRRITIARIGIEAAEEAKRRAAARR